ncbi:hypothetical protein MASR2M8_10530 [Opitutaceae bacterium]
MHEFLACALATHRPRLLQRWDQSLRALPPSSALAHPDSLVHLMPTTLDRLHSALAAHAVRRRSTPSAACACGMNPLVTFFITAETALIDTLFIEEPAWARLSRTQREVGLALLRATLHTIANDDIEAFCSLCQMRGTIGRDRQPSSARAVSAPV